MEGTPFTIAMVNRKGGVGKSGSCHQLSGCFSQMGYRVLLVDMDPQASLTQGFFGPAATEALPPRKDRTSPVRRRIRHGPGGALSPDRVRANHSPSRHPRPWDRFNKPEPETTGSLQRSLRAFLGEVEHRFDVVIIDCPPNLYLCSWNALLAADFAVVPLQAEDFGAQGIPHIQRAIDRVVESANPRLKLMGYLLTMFDKRLAIHLAYEERLRELYGPMVFNAVFPARKDIKEAIASRRPIHHLRPRSSAAGEVMAIAEELIRRVPETRARPAGFLRPGERVVGGQITRRAI